MDAQYFSDRESGPRARTAEEISDAAWGGIVALISARLNDNSFAYEYPGQCPDGEGIWECDGHLFNLALKSEIQDVDWPPNAGEKPSAISILDLLQFCYRVIAKPIQGSHHPFFRHFHLSFDRLEGQDTFRTSINRIFARNGIAFELEENGQIERMAPIGLRDILHSAMFNTRDQELDSLLSDSRTRYLDPDPAVRRDALEKLWDAWERLKTLEPGNDKRASAGKLLDIASDEPKFRELLEQEAKELTRIGNTFGIRHSETTQTPLRLNEHVDYLYHRLFCLIRLLLQVSSRMGLQQFSPPEPPRPRL